MSRISVLIPMYNAGDGVRKTLDSIKRQTLIDYEVIIVNDGSQDDSERIARSTFPQATIFRKKNGGIASALNYGLPHCRGRYIARIDCNDIAEPDWLESLSSALDGDAALGAVGGHIRLFERDGRQLGICRFPVNPADAERDLLLGKSPLIHSGSMIRKSIMDEVGGYDEFFNWREDFELWCRISLVSKITNIDQVVVNVLSAQEGISYSQVFYYPLVELALAERKEKERRDVFWKDKVLRAAYADHINKLKQYQDLPRNARRQDAIFFAKRAAFLHRSSNRKVAVQEYIRVIKSDPSYPKGWLGLITALTLPMPLYLTFLQLYKRLSLFRSRWKNQPQLVGRSHR